jgi:hypothetical protein
MSVSSWSKSKTATKAPSGPTVTVWTESLSKNGANTPNFEAKVRLGQQLPMNAYTRTYSRVDRPLGVEEVWQWNPTLTSKSLLLSRDRYQPDFASTWTVISPSITDAVVQLAALDDFWDNASRNRSDYGLMVAEGRKTANLVTTTALRLALAFKHLRRKDVLGAYKALGLNLDKTGSALQRAARGAGRGAANHSRFAASSFLEMQYGWKPLLSDVYTAAEDLAYRNQKQSFDVVIVGSAQQEGEYKYAVADPGGGYPGTLTARISSIGENRKAVRVSYCCRYRVVNPTLRTASALGLTNPLALAWELLPFSFVVDWFVPIGNYFESMSALQGLSFIGGTRSVLTVSDQSAVLSGSGGISTSTKQERIWRNGIYWENKSVNFVRSSVSSPSRPGPFRLNPKAMGSDRPLKALALMRVTVRK